MFISLFALVARLWAYLSARGLEISVQGASDGLFPGESLEFKIKIHNSKFLPLIWLELFAPIGRDECLLPLDSREADDWEYGMLEEMRASTRIVGEKRLGSVMWYETLKTTMLWTAQKRGVYSMKNWTLRTGDGFGLAQVETPLPESEVREIYVYPRLQEVLPDLFLRNLWNSESGSRGVMEDLSVIRSTRDYMAGDSFKHINWRLAARGLPITVNVYEDILPKSAHFIIDANSFLGGTMHLDELEDTLSVIASLIVRLDGALVACGLSLPEGHEQSAVSLFPTGGAVVPELLRALSAFVPKESEYDIDASAQVFKKSVFHENAILSSLKSAGRFYYVAYDSVSLRKNPLLRALGESGATVLTYTEPEGASEFEHHCLKDLKGVREND